MNIKALAGLALAAALVAACVSEGHEHHANQAKVSKEDATRTALAQVPNGTLKASELEKERGKLIWSFDLATPGSSELTEVNIDAITGQVVATSKESPESESKERN
jgi:uncharacterized membrane protein YkoI